MDCGGCARTTEAGVRRLPGVQSADVNFGAATLSVVPANADLRPGSVVAAVDEFERNGQVAVVRELSSHGVVAMGVAGSDVALEAAGVALLADDLHQLPLTVRLSRSTMANIRQNVAVSLLVKAVFLFLTLAGVTNLWLAVAAHLGTSLLVTFNALRLLRYRGPGD